jgi:hypothetical protein
MSKPAGMKRYSTIKLMAVIMLMLPFLFTACIKDHCKNIRTYTYYEPVYHTKEEVRANIKSNAPQPIENPGKLNILGNYIFLNEIDKGVHVIDNSNPSQPRNIAFIDIPGNVDIAIKGNILYADLYTDLVVLDISDPSHVMVKKIIDFLFPERLYSGGFVADNSKVITDWKRVDVTVTENCNGPGWTGPGRGGVVFFDAQTAGGPAASSSSPVGVGGSMARFTIVNNYMYTVDRHTLNSLSISNPADPVLSGNINAGWDIETIYPFKNKLFLGSMGGMFIYDISDPANPVQQSNFIHARACDPVIADDNYAYITLSSGTNCGPTKDELQIVNVQNLSSPALIRSYDMTNPHGLSKDDNLLFICDGKDGLKVFNASDVQNLQHIKTFGGLETYDVIAFNNRAIVVAKDGLYQYDYSNTSNIHLLSKIATKN